MNYSVNFSNLKTGLLASSLEYIEYYKNHKTRTQVVCFVLSLLRSPYSKNPACAENIRNIVPYLNPESTRDQKALLLIARTVIDPKTLADLDPNELNELEQSVLAFQAPFLATQTVLESATTKLADLATGHLIEVRRNEDSLSGYFGPKYAFEFTIQQVFVHFKNYSNRALAAHILRCLGGPNNSKGLNALLKAPAQNSIARVPLHLFCIWNFHKNTSLATLPREILKMMVDYVRADIKESLLKKIEEAVTPNN